MLSEKHKKFSDIALDRFGFLAWEAARRQLKDFGPLDKTHILAGVMIEFVDFLAAEGEITINDRQEIK